MAARARKSAVWKAMSCKQAKAEHLLAAAIWIIRPSAMLSACALRA